MRVAFLVLLVLPAVVVGQPSPERQLALTSLRDGERARLEKVVGSGDALPLYQADLAFDLRRRKLSGLVTLTLTPDKPVSELWLRSTPNAIHQDAIAIANATVNGAAVKVLRPDASLYHLVFAEPAPAGAPLRVLFKLGANVPPAPDARLTLGSAHGPTDYGAFSSAPEVTSLAGLIPRLVPRKANGELFGPPSGIGDLGAFEPAHWLVSLTVATGCVVVAPGTELGVVPDGKGSVRASFGASGARDFPLFVTHGYHVTTEDAGGVTIEVHALPSDRVSANRAAQTARAALEQFEAKLGPYPFKSLRIVEARLDPSAGGMEFPGLIAISTSLFRGSTNPATAMGLGDDPQLSALIAPMLKGLLEPTFDFAVMHEVAHQYSAMLVGSDAVDEPIADEPLTQHLALLALEWSRGKKEADQAREQQLKLAYQVFRMGGGVDGKANRPTSEFQSSLEYGALVYGKAPLLFDAQRKLVGNDAWTAILRTYFDEHRYRFVTPQTLTELAASKHPKLAEKLRALRTHWWEEAHGDEDLGTASLGSLGGAAGLGSLGGLDVDPKQLEELMKQLEGALGQ